MSHSNGPREGFSFPYAAMFGDLNTNVRPERSYLVLLLRRVASLLRTKAYFSLKCRYAKRKGFIRIPWSVSIWAPNRIIEFGHKVQFGPRCVIQSDVKIGDSVLIAGDVAFVGRNDHSIHCAGQTIWNSPRGMPLVTTVEDDVWIGYGCIILSGVTIGRGSVVAAGSVVTTDIDRYTIVAGCPAKEIAKRFSSVEIQSHEQILGLP